MTAGDLDVGPLPWHLWERRLLPTYLIRSRFIPAQVGKMPIGKYPVGKTPVGKYPVGKAPAPAPLVTKG